MNTAFDPISPSVLGSQPPEQGNNAAEFWPLLPNTSMFGQPRHLPGAATTWIIYFRLNNWPGTRWWHPGFDGPLILTSLEYII